MRNRQAAGQRADSHFSRASGAVARSPAERLEPTRPTARRRPSRTEREARRVSPLLRVASGLFTFALLVMLIVGGIALLFDGQIEAPGPLGQSKVVVIPKGEGAHEIASRLEREGVISDRRLFIAGYLWARLSSWFEGGKSVQLRAGDFEVKQSASIREVVDLLSEGKTVSYKVTIPEGLTSHQIVERLKADPNLTGDVAAVPAEGSLLPDTFVVERGSSRQVVLDNMQAQARRLTERMWAQRKKDLPLKSWEEAVVLASIVEKETGRNDERERVAAVFINRLRQNMRLQSDPTILYGLTQGKVVWNRAIQKNEITQKTAHNTYQIDGLPPTPICNPGRAAIAAVLNPADTRDLYFVADGAGGHVFSETLRDHNSNVSKWRVHEREIKAKAGPAAASADTPTTAVAPTAPAPPKARPAAAAPAKTKAAEKPREPATDPKR